MEIKYDVEQIQKLYDTGKSIRQVSKILDIPKHVLFKFSQKGILVPRTRSAAASLIVASEETKEKHKANAKLQGFGGYQPNAGRSQREWRTDSEGREVLLQSSYETKLADLLKEMNLHWIRPSPFNYTLDGVNRRYYPDFLVEGRILIDTKNNYLAKQDGPKIQAVEKQNNLKVHVLGLTQINIESIRMLL